MKCSNRGIEFDDDGPVRPQCGGTGDQVEVLPPEERDNFRGITIGDEPPAADRPCQSSQSENGGSRRRVYVKTFNFGGSTPGGIITKLLAAAVMIGLIIVALPLVLIIAGLIAVSWLLTRLRK